MDHKSPSFVAGAASPLAVLCAAPLQRPARLCAARVGKAPHAQPCACAWPSAAGPSRPACAWRRRRRRRRPRRQATAAGTPAKRPKTSPHFRKGAFPPVVDEQTPPHTLLLGTQPSDTSLRENRYFMTNANVFWHIVGDALGFRRGFHVDGRTEACDFIRPHLLHDEELDYDDAVKKFTGAGYALWDTVASSQRKGSLDSAIQDAEYADVRGLLRTYPSIRRICFATGGGSAKIFAKAHAAWLKEPGAFRRRDDALCLSLPEGADDRRGSGALHPAVRLAGVEPARDLERRQTATEGPLRSVGRAARGALPLQKAAVVRRMFRRRAVGSCCGAVRRFGF